MSDRLRSRDRLTPLVGAGVAVALVVVLAAVVTMLVLGANEATDAGPEMDFSFEYDADASAAREDSFGNTGQSFDGLLTIRYEGGPTVDARSLVVAGAAGQPGSASFARAGFAADSTIEAGDTVTVWVDRDDAVRVVWDPLDADERVTVDSWSGD